MSVQIHPARTPSVLERQYDRLKQEARVAMREATRIAHQEMRELAPGSIAEHVEERVSSSPGAVYGTVFPTSDHAKYVDEGTGLYIEFHQPIRPKADRRASNPRAALRLKDGRYRKQVRGQRPQRFRDRAEEQAQNRVIEILEHAGDATIEPLKH